MTKVGCLTDFQLDGYVSGILLEEDKAVVAVHLKTCERCAKVVKKLSRALSLLNQQEIKEFGALLADANGQKKT